jgi:hypothetical protein
MHILDTRLSPQGAELLSLLAYNTAVAQEKPPPRPEVQPLEEVV